MSQVGKKGKGKSKKSKGQSKGKGASQNQNQSKGEGKSKSSKMEDKVKGKKSMDHMVRYPSILVFKIKIKVEKVKVIKYVLTAVVKVIE